MNKMPYKVRYSPQTALFNDGRLVVWFSCGAASACALKLLEHYNPTAVYCDVRKNEDSDNQRFMQDVEKWTNTKIQLIRSDLYSTVEEVFEARRYMSGPKGAPCTTEMKKRPRFRFQNAADVHVFGMAVDELDRVQEFEQNNPDLNLCWPLVEAGMTKGDCFSFLKFHGIELPAAYKKGFKNNNCIGCVKSASPAYWNLVRKHHPAVFQSRAEQSRAIGCRLVKLKGVRIFLDELPPDETEDLKENLSCGPQCAGQSEPEPQKSQND